MAMTQLDKMKLLDIVKKKKINSYSDLNINTRSKVTIEDTLDTMINIVVKLMKESTNEKIVLNSLGAMEIIIEEMYENDLEIDETISKRISVFKSLDTFNNEQITLIINNIASTCPEYGNDEVEIKEKPLEDNSKTSIEDNLDELSTVIQNYESQIKELNKKIENFKCFQDRSQKKSQEKATKISKLQKEIERLKKETHKLRSNYNNLESRYNKVSQELKNKEEEISDLQSQTKEYYKMCVTMDEQTKTIESIKHQEIIVDAVLEIISTSRVTITEISRILSERGIKASIDCIKEALSELGKTYEIEDSVLINFEKTYNIISRKATSHRTFSVKTLSNRYDCLVLSDAHFSTIKDFDIRLFDKIYDYMIKYRVNTILNIGDFIEVNHLSGSTCYNRVKYNDTIINSIIKSFPFEKGIKHLVLGGNHEEDFFRYGIDPLEILESNREDFVSLGYGSANLKLNKDYIGLFHPHARLKTEENKVAALNYLNQYVTNKCKSANIEREKMLLSLFGHYHTGDFFNMGIITVPSLTRDRKKDGLLHLVIYFEGKDNNRRIKRIEATRLSINKVINPQETYVYKRELKKKENNH